MSWVDVRVPRSDVATTMQVLTGRDWAWVGLLQVDLTPPAAGPEVEVSLYVAEERDAELVGTQLVDLLRLHAVTVLAHRARDWPRQ